MGRTGIAIFTRNHPEYLEKAAETSAKNPNAKVVFRAKARWATAERELPLGGSLPIYIADIDGGNKISYVAELCHVQLDPQRGIPETERLLEDELALTKGESLWETPNGEPTVQTLYAIRACRELDEPFPVTTLVKISDGKPISADYIRSYAIVEALGK